MAGKRAYRLICAILAALLALPFAVCAEEAVSVTVDGRVVRVEGTIDKYGTWLDGFDGPEIDGDNPPEAVLTLLAAGRTPEELAGATAEDHSMISAVMQQTVDGAGRFSFTLKVSGESGGYNAIITSKLLEEPMVVEFHIIYSVLDDLNEKKNGATLAQFRTVIENEAALLGLSMKEYELLSDDEKNVLCENLKNREGDYTDKTAFAGEFNEQCLLAAIVAKAAEPEVVASILRAQYELEASPLRTDVVGFLKDRLSDDQQAGLIGELFSEGTAFRSIADFNARLRDRLLLRYLEIATYWKDVSYVIETQNNTFELPEQPLAVYMQELKERNPVLQGLYERRPGYRTAADVRNQFAALVQQQSEQERNEKPSGSSSGGRGGNTGGGNRQIVVEASPAPPQPSEVPGQSGFSDLNTAEWAREAIETLADWKLLKGVGGGRFAPDEIVTREQFAQMLDNAFGYSKSSFAGTFTDVPADAWFYPAVCGMQEQGILRGDETGAFGVGQPISRQDAAVILQRAFAMQKPENAESSSFIDTDLIADYARDAVEILMANGVISGMEDGRFAPEQLLTRAQAAKILFEALMQSGYFENGGMS